MTSDPGLPTAPVRPPEAARQSTRAQLLEAAGQIFAERGVDRATGKEICERAGTNAAAVNYYFGGMEGLYAAVLQAAHDRFITVEALAAAVAAEPDARAKLEAVIRLVVGTLTGPLSSTWAVRVLGRELVAPTPALDRLRREQFLPKAAILKGIVGDLMGLPPDHPTVARGCVSIVAPFLLLLLADRTTLLAAFPAFGADGPESIARHMLRFALAGLAAVAAGPPD